MSDDSGSYDILVIRELLISALTVQDLHRLSTNSPVLRPLLNYFSPADGLVDCVDKVISFCEKQLLWDELLEQVAGFNPKQYARFRSRLGIESTPTARKLTFSVQCGDVSTFKADVLALKFAQALFGADRDVAIILDRTALDIKRDMPNIGDYKLFSTEGRLATPQVLYQSGPSLYNFDYEQIRRFGANVLAALDKVAPATRHLSMTIHGPGYGLDEAEALRSQLAGIMDAIAAGNYPDRIERITIVERDNQRVDRLRRVLNTVLPDSEVVLPVSKASPGISQPDEQTRLMPDIGRRSADKPHVVVAVPATEDMEDYFYYGIQTPIHAAGCLCERMDLRSLKNDLLERLMSRIQTADLVVTELTTSDPNICLAVGYAWGKGRPVLLLTRDATKLPFDMQGQRCVVYSHIRDLEEAMKKELQATGTGAPIAR